MKLFVWKTDFEKALELGTKLGYSLTDAGATVFVGERVNEPDKWFEFPITADQVKEIKK